MAKPDPRSVIGERLKTLHADWVVLELHVLAYGVSTVMALAKYDDVSVVSQIPMILVYILARRGQ